MQEFSDFYKQERFKYGDYSNTRYGALKSLSKKKLNCVDSTHITVALLRAANIPAKYTATKNININKIKIIIEG